MGEAVCPDLLRELRVETLGGQVAGAEVGEWGRIKFFYGI